jgi:hypothetical protein
MKIITPFEVLSIFKEGAGTIYENNMLAFAF